ncbi:hypothetical protein [Actinocrispum sp. NPDC049592]|uniref:hypothetical protein n=1 Tax=Actinocrispum sp. NPDC049592 TaxID=3154835 RepID=UPI00343161DF
MTRYDRRALAVAYVEAQPEYRHPERVRRQQVLMGLQELFGCTVDETQLSTVHWGLFDSTVRSYFGITHPGQADADEPARVPLDTIADLNKQSRAAHIDVLEAILAAYVDDRVFTSEDLHAIGIDD